MTTLLERIDAHLADLRSAGAIHDSIYSERLAGARSQSDTSLQRLVAARLAEARQARQAPQVAAAPATTTRAPTSSGLSTPASALRGIKIPMTGLSPAESWIISRESGGRTNAKNPKSTAFGLGQLILSNRKKYLPDDPWTTDPTRQLAAFRSYVADRYGTAEKAQAFWTRNRYY